MPVTRNCAYCGKGFTVYPYQTNRFCSHSCAQKFRYKDQKQPEIICQTCGKIFAVKPYRKGVTRFCSVECCNEWQKTGRVQKRHEREIKTCSQCGNQFEAVQYLDDICKSCKGGSKKCMKCGKVFYGDPGVIKKSSYCSRECANTASNRIEIECDQCGKSFCVTPTILNRGRRFCSFRCSLGYKGQSKIEKVLAGELKRRGFSFETQYYIQSGNPKGWWIDIAFPAHRLAIEVDGDYWHSLPGIKDKDRRKDTDLRGRGWTILRFTESEIKKNVSGCADIIARHL